jgi:hypothetical protein
MSQKQNHRFLLTIIWVVFVLANPVFAQKSFDELENLPLFSNENEIVNGEQWIYQKRYAGHPFWKDDIWYNGYVNYKGERFDDVSMRYDIHTNNIIILKKLANETRAYKLNKHYLNSFALFDTKLNNTVVFQYGHLTDSINKEIYFNAYNGEFGYYILYRKVINNRVSETYAGEFIEAPILYAHIHGQLIEFKTQADLLKLFGNRKPEIKKFIRQNRIKYRKKNPEVLIPVFQHYDVLTNTTHQ